MRSALLRWARAATLLSGVAQAACGDPAGPTARLDEAFVLAPGQQATIADTRLTVMFIGVEGDSRCPADAICIQGGDAIVRIDVQAPGGSRTPHELHTGDMKPVEHEGFVIALVELSPYPFSSRTIQPDEYRATLRVTQ